MQTEPEQIQTSNRQHQHQQHPHIINNNKHNNRQKRVQKGYSRIVKGKSKKSQKNYARAIQAEKASDAGTRNASQRKADPRGGRKVKETMIDALKHISAHDNPTTEGMP